MERSPTDSQVLLASAVGDSYGVALRPVGNTADVEDWLQDAALNALRGCPSFQEGTNFRAWFYRILVNQSYPRYRRERRSLEVASFDDEVDNGGPSAVHAFGGTPDLDPANALIQRMDGEKISATLRSLPEAYRVVAILYFSQDLSYQEIAEILEVPIGTVRSRLHRARQFLQERLRQLAVSNGVALPVKGRSLFTRLPLRSSCRKVIARLGEYLDGETSPADCGLIERHLAVCRKCRRRLELVKDFVHTVRTKLGRIPCPREAQDRIMHLLGAALGGR